MALQTASMMGLTPRPARHATEFPKELSVVVNVTSLLPNKAGSPRRSQPAILSQLSGKLETSATPTFATIMRILLHPQLRTALPKSVQRDLRARVWTRFKSQAPRPSRRQEAASPAPKDLSAATTRTSSPAGAAAKINIRRGTEPHLTGVS